MANAGVRSSRRAMVPGLFVVFILEACASAKEPSVDATSMGGATGAAGGHGSGGTSAGGVGSGLVDAECPPLVARAEGVIEHADGGDGGISTAAPCAWQLGAEPGSTTTVDPFKVNLRFDDPPALPLMLENVREKSSCSANGWYYDTPSQPSRIVACPTTCKTIRASHGGTVELLLGCATLRMN